MKHHLRDLLLLTAGCAVSAVLLCSGLATRPDPSTLFAGSVSSLQNVAGFAAAAAGLLLALWWSLGIVLAVLSAALRKAGHAAAATAAGALAPAFMKRLAAAAVGINLVAGAGAAQAADSLPGTPPGQSVALLHHPLDTAAQPRWDTAPDLSGRGTDQAAADSPVSPQWKPSPQRPSTNVFIRPERSGAADRTVVVRAGDSRGASLPDSLAPRPRTRK
ncbi:hypothetical protein OL239_05965 [Arthrobacter sp. ATA002]|uniref:hypothetical protein n=1 Tax=Arthrobacter sp. ATA002 TaxID=2991715 RepID=UPI0022A75DF2|nr:hypothetical protein [Arthrobacter sp. ATA002]WAP52739.1 hypothetical protein OL239_05965 [Arthrobacter sp. ATA002]